MSKVHFVLDEAAALGHLDCIDDALGLGRAYGIRLQFYYQSLAQASKCFPDGQEQVLLSNTTQVYFAVNDQQTADLVSNRLGEKTIIVQSGGTSSGTSRSTTSGRDQSTTRGSSHTVNHNWQPQARKLEKPEEVMALSPRTAITFAPGMRPICTTLVRYYETNLCPGRLARFRNDFFRLAKAALLCVFAVNVAAGLAKATGTKARPPVPMSREPRLIRSPHVESNGDS